jgi:hypothetical protein
MSQRLVTHPAGRGMSRAPPRPSSCGDVIYYRMTAFSKPRNLLSSDQGNRPRLQRGPNHCPEVGQLSLKNPKLGHPHGQSQQAGLRETSWKLKPLPAIPRATRGTVAHHLEKQTLQICGTRGGAYSPPASGSRVQHPENYATTCRDVNPTRPWDGFTRYAYSKQASSEYPHEVGQGSNRTAVPAPPYA